MSTIDRLIDSVVRCTICGQPKGCDCWEECWCGWTYQRGTICQRDHDAYLASSVFCECGVPFGARHDCGTQRNLKNPCRCHCHKADLRAGRQRFEAAQKAEAERSPRLLNLLGTTVGVETAAEGTPPRRSSRGARRRR